MKKISWGKAVTIFGIALAPLAFPDWAITIAEAYSPSVKVVNSPIIGSLSGQKKIDPSNPTVVITHGWQPVLFNCKPSCDTPEWVDDMKSDIEVSSDANVYTWTWQGAFTPPASGKNGLIELVGKTFSQALSEVKNQGVEIGKQLAALGSGALDHLQLIGHSLGTLVNAYAANYLTKLGFDVEQFTILDRPFGNDAASFFTFGVNASGIDEPMFQTLLSKDKVKWVDNYWGDDSGVIYGAKGAEFENANAYQELIPGANHSEVHEAYSCSISEDCASGWELNGGFPLSLAGGGSPSFDEADRWDPGTLKNSKAHKILMVDPVKWLTFNGILESGADCSEGSPAYLWNSDFTIPEETEYLSFEFFWDNPGDGDYLTVHFGDRLLFNYIGTSFDDSDFVSSGLIPLTGLSGLTDQLLFTLNSVGESNAQFRIRDLTLYENSVPEPGTIALLMLGLIILLYGRTGRRPCRIT